MPKKFRQFAFSVLAVLTYLVVHEAVHLFQALAYHIFEGVRFTALGVEVLITEPLVITGWRLASFSGASSIVTLLTGYLLFVLTSKILTLDCQFLKSYLYYTTFVFLLLDSLYMAFLSFFVGGDLNGIVLGSGISSTSVRIIFALILLLNVTLVVKTLYPAYTQNFKHRHQIPLCIYTLNTLFR